MKSYRTGRMIRLDGPFSSLAQEKQGLIVEWGAVSGHAVAHRAANRLQRLLSVLAQFLREPLDAKLLAGSVRGFQQTIGVQGKNIAASYGRCATHKFSVGKNAERHIGTFPFFDFVASRTKLQNSRMPGQSQVKLFALLGDITKGHKHILSLANCYEGRYYRQIAPRKGDASPFLNGLGDSETIGAAKRTWNQ
jgi:hypothetical protein